MPARTFALTCFAMLCFAANSLLCRMALAPELVDPATFTTVRVLSAVAMLVVVVWLRRQHLPRIKYAKAGSIAALFGYLIFFSFAYARLTAATGALILFGSVQLTMFGIALREGEHFSALSWAGLAIAVSGLVYLVLPGLSAPDPLGAVMMAISGISWGLFSLLARGADDPVEANATNFLFCLPPAMLVNVAFIGDFHATAGGLGLAIASGAIASGLGYVIWYFALRELPATRAATVQLSVPAIAALGGVALLSEPLTARLLIASAAMLGGVAIVLAQRASRSISAQPPRA
jgi:drug/metabolite transporter (DMT)-like permease